MAEIREGGCLCGTVRYRVKGNPVRASACHCTFCKRRTGSALGMLVLFDEANVEIAGGPLRRMNTDLMRVSVGYACSFVHGAELQSP
jgi:hypothetical protein